jgi:hypothetical protein
MNDVRNKNIQTKCWKHLESMESKTLPGAENVWIMDRALSLSIRFPDDLISGELLSKHHEHRKWRLVFLVSPCGSLHENSTPINRAC